MAEQGSVKLDQPAIQIIITRRIQLSQDERMAANCSLTINNQAAGENIRTFNSNRNRRCHESAAKVIVRPHHDAFAAMDIHGVIGDFSAEFGAVILQDRRWNGRFFNG